MYHILAIDDDPKLLGIMAEALNSLNCNVEFASDGDEGLSKAYETKPDLILLDIMMPGLDGWQVCQQLREMTEVPIIIISALGADDDLVKGSDLGADDYLVKPIPIAVLRARVTALLRRSHGNNWNSRDTILAHQGLKINIDQRRVTYQDRPVQLSPTEYELLVCLMRHKQKVLSMAFLLAEVWGIKYEDDPSKVRLYIRYLRQKLKACGVPDDMIHNEFGVGYRFD